jgi:MHS family proline/betaine transporter-like MFS transporter
MMQKFFAAGEYNGAAIYLLEHARNEEKGYISGKYCAYTVLGIILAAIVSTIVSYLGASYWRWPYFIGFLTGIFGFYIRAKAPESPEFVKSKADASLNYSIIKNNILKITAIIGSSAFFGCLYTIPAMLITSLVPLITNLPAQTVMLINVISLFIYMIFLPISGYIADKIGISKSMIYACIATIIATLGLIKLLSSNSLAHILMLKSIFAIISAWYIGPFHAQVQVMFSVNTRYRLVSLNYCIGSQIGGAMPAVSLYLWQKSQNLMLIGAVLIFWAIVGAISCFVIKKAESI